jgi:uroporphyrin-3 C-methyltransferase
MQQDLARRLTDMDGNNKASQVLMIKVQESMRELSVKVSVLEAHYAETQNQRAALEALYQDLSGSRDETVLAEVEQLLLIAGQQLQLSANVKAALIAMQQADDRLKRMDRAALNGLRKAINRDIDKLRTLPAVNVQDIKFRLDNLIAEVDTLPLVQDIATVPQGKNVAATTPVRDEGAWRRLMRELWEDMKRLVRVENMQKRELPLLPPTQTFFLRENLKLRLLSARLGLLSRDEKSFKHDLQSVQDWTVRYFDVKSPSGTLAVTTLQKLRESNINIELPDISASLEAARNYRFSLGKGSR